MKKYRVYWSMQYETEVEAVDAEQATNKVWELENSGKLETKKERISDIEAELLDN